ncbi:hypothetical protein [Natranaeroarchaeum aerophilus]|uniref:Uncharacterized protein n=1 Tax=Natranaeroarchaeum aerophilus TaxID=2917711 RepID=A0AAE3K6Z5_9EURY|nr:hypothetical protein [Natranaeroarchaeum aerophilus]MCL9814900.1 hypothetical protein [Natranaeroarchaeum aerophilus]
MTEDTREQTEHEFGEDQVLRYGEVAAAVGEPDKRFGRLDDQFVLIPEQLLGWSMIKENEVESREIDLSNISSNGQGLVLTKLEPTSLQTLSAKIQHGTQLSEQEARVVVLFSGLVYDRERVAAELDMEEREVERCLTTVEGRYDKEQIVADLTANTDLDTMEAEVFTLAKTFEYDHEAIAAELDLAEPTVAEMLRNIETEHEIDGLAKNGNNGTKV